jgi:hypothetical protein
MKRQYLGDSKDSFKWDYLDYLTTGLDYPLLNVMLMLTPDDSSKQGNTEPELFPSRAEVIDFCRVLKKQRDCQLIKKLPKSTDSKYHVELHKEETYFTSENRQDYFTDLSSESRQVLFLDPDNGFEPEQSRTEQHVLYSDVVAILKQISEETIISVFQHFRYISFNKDFARIKERIPNGYTTALYWHSLMFVTISKTKEIIEKVGELNHKYSQKYPVKVLQ